MKDDAFYLYDLRVELIRAEGEIWSYGAKIGDYFEVQGENLVFPKDTVFSMYNLAAILPLLPAKQRETHPNDWMTTDAEVTGPDPNCKAIFKITRLGKRTFTHSETTCTDL